MTVVPQTTGAPAATGRARRRIGVGVIGFGWLGQAHSRSILRIPTLFPERDFEAELVVCGDTLPERLADAVHSFGSALGKLARAFTSLMIVLGLRPVFYALWIVVSLRFIADLSRRTNLWTRFRHWAAG